MLVHIRIVSLTARSFAWALMLFAVHATALLQVGQSNGRCSKTDAPRPTRIARSKAGILQDVRADGLRNVPYIHGSHAIPESRWLIAR